MPHEVFTYSSVQPSNRDVSDYEYVSYDQNMVMYPKYSNKFCT